MTSSLIRHTWPSKRLPFSSLYTRLLQIIGGSLFIALCAQIKIPLLFSPVPITMHTFAIMLLGGFLGKRDGVLAVLAYLFELTIGLPFGHSGLSSPFALIGPTGGYLVGFLLQAYFAGWVVEKGWKASPMKIMAALSVVTTLQLLVGACWLAKFVGYENALNAGVYPFLIGDYLKCLAVTQILVKWKR